jgi:ABC-2 type transport system ATP-binding protein
MSVTLFRDEVTDSYRPSIEPQVIEQDKDRTAVIEIEHLAKAYGGVPAVNDISLTVFRGEIFGLLGPNGAGKSTTVEMIEGLRKADSGRISILDTEVKGNIDGIKQKIGVQLQVPSLLPLLSVEETLNMFSRVYKHSLTTKHLIELLSLEENRKVLVKNLSGGQQQRLSLAMALVNDPEIIFLDEPTTGLDPQARRNLWSVIEDMRNRGKTILLTTHYMEEAERLCNRIAIIDHGKIIALDTPRDLICSYFKESAIQFEMDPTPPIEDLQRFKGASQVLIENSEIVIYSSDIPGTMSALLDYVKNQSLTDKIKNINVRQATLEDVFLKITGRKIGRAHV